jgi:hypothetical protein
MLSTPVHVGALMGQHRDHSASVRVKRGIDADITAIFIAPVIDVGELDFAGLFEAIEDVHDLLAVKGLAKGGLRQGIDVVGQQNRGIRESVLITAHGVILSLRRLEAH